MENIAKGVQIATYISNIMIQTYLDVGWSSIECILQLCARLHIGDNVQNFIITPLFNEWNKKYMFKYVPA